MSETPDTQSEASVNPMRSLLGVAVILLLGLLAAAGLKSYSDLKEQRAHELKLEQSVEVTKARIEHLTQRIERIKNDPMTLETLAREELGMVRPADLVIIFPEAQ